jgi:hypothetical protein
MGGIPRFYHSNNSANYGVPILKIIFLQLTADRLTGFTKLGHIDIPTSASMLGHYISLLGLTLKFALLV